MIKINCATYAAATLGFQKTAIMVDEGNLGMSMDLTVCVELILESGQELERLVNGSVLTEATTASGRTIHSGNWTYRILPRLRPCLKLHPPPLLSESSCIG